MCLFSYAMSPPPPILSWESELLTARVVQLVHKLEFIFGPVTLKAFVPLMSNSFGCGFDMPQNPFPKISHTSFACLGLCSFSFFSIKEYTQPSHGVTVHGLKDSTIVAALPIGG